MNTYLITGASRGIGRAIAKRLASTETHLILHGRDEKALAKTCKDARNKGAEVASVISDFATTEGVERVSSAAGNVSINALINNAGIAIVKPVEEHTLEEWQRTIAVNITAPFLLVQQLLPRMERGSAIVNISSTGAFKGYANWSSYCMSKFAMEGFAQSIREELRPRGIRVLNINPASTDTDIWNNVPGNWPRDKMLDPAQVAEAVAFMLERPDSVATESIILRSIAGEL